MALNVVKQVFRQEYIIIHYFIVSVKFPQRDLVFTLILQTQPELSGLSLPCLISYLSISPSLPLSHPPVLLCSEKLLLLQTLYIGGRSRSFWSQDPERLVPPHRHIDHICLFVSDATISLWGEEITRNSFHKDIGLDLYDAHNALQYIKAILN